MLKQFFKRVTETEIKNLIGKFGRLVDSFEFYINRLTINVSSVPISMDADI